MNRTIDWYYGDTLNNDYGFSGSDHECETDKLYICIKENDKLVQVYQNSKTYWRV